LYPSWRERFKFLLDNPSDAVDNNHNNGNHDQESVLGLWSLIRDSTRTGNLHSSKLKDEIIVQTFHQFDSDQLLSHNTSYWKMTLPLTPPHALKWRKGRVAIDSRAELKIGIQSFLSGAKQFEMMIREVHTLLKSLKLLMRIQQQEQDREKQEDDSREQEPVYIYSLEGTVIMKIYRLLKIMKTFQDQQSTSPMPQGAPTTTKKRSAVPHPATISPQRLRQQQQPAPTQQQPQQQSRSNNKSAANNSSFTRDDQPQNNQMNNNNQNRRPVRSASNPRQPSQQQQIPLSDDNYYYNDNNDHHNQSSSIYSFPSSSFYNEKATANNFSGYDNMESGASRSPIRIVGLAERNKVDFQKSLRDYDPNKRTIRPPPQKRRSSSAPPPQSFSYLAAENRNPGMMRGGRAFDQVSELSSFSSQPLQPIRSSFPQQHQPQQQQSQRGRQPERTVPQPQMSGNSVSPRTMASNNTNNNMNNINVDTTRLTGKKHPLSTSPRPPSVSTTTTTTSTPTNLINPSNKRKAVDLSIFKRSGGSASSLNNSNSSFISTRSQDTITKNVRKGWK
jgi:hypothetical protein